MLSVIEVAPDLKVLRLRTIVSTIMSYGTYVPMLESTLIDCGFRRARKTLRKGLEGTDIEQLLITHGHEDHFGNAADLHNRLGCKVLAPAGALPILERPEILRMFPYTRLLWARPEACPAEALPEEVRVGKLRLQVISTPGHCEIHSAFFEPERRWLFTGDLFLSVKVKQARLTENVPDLIESLKKVTALEPELLLCTHRGVVDDPVPRLKAKIKFLETLRDQSRALKDKGIETNQIARKLLGREDPGYQVVTWGDYSKRNLVEISMREPGDYGVGDISQPGQ